MESTRLQTATETSSCSNEQLTKFLQPPNFHAKRKRRAKSLTEKQEKNRSGIAMSKSQWYARSLVTCKTSCPCFCPCLFRRPICIGNASQALQRQCCGMLHRRFAKGQRIGQQHPVARSFEPRPRSLFFFCLPSCV